MLIVLAAHPFDLENDIKPSARTNNSDGLINCVLYKCTNRS